MRKEIAKQMEIFEIYNDIALQDELVVYGSDYTADFPFYELSQKFLLEHALYNRSIKGMTLEEAQQGLNRCVLSLHPAKVLLCFGEGEDIKTLATYRNILREIKAKLPRTDIYVLPVRGAGETVKAYNQGLAALCKEQGALFLDIRYFSPTGALPYERVFGQFIRFFCKQPLTMAQAFTLI